MHPVDAVTLVWLVNLGQYDLFETDRCFLGLIKELAILDSQIFIRDLYWVELYLRQNLLLVLPNEVSEQLLGRIVAKDDFIGRGRKD